MAGQRRRHSAPFKLKVALDAARETKTIAQLASEYVVHSNLINKWKKQLLDDGSGIFSRATADGAREHESVQSDLFEQIGRLKLELEWLEKKLPSSCEEKRRLVDPLLQRISIRRQCELAGLNRSSLYYAPAVESPLNLELMRAIDEQYLKAPFYGWERMTAHLRRMGFEINAKRVRRLMRTKGLEAIHPKPRMSVPDREHRVYPYLLRNLEVFRPNQVWCADITYVPMDRGLMYLVAIMDWFSRYVISFEISNSLDADVCLRCLDRALSFGKPEIFNTDQGSQFTSRSFTSALEEAGIRASMDGRGRAMDKIFIERLWKSIKYEDVYLKAYPTGMELIRGLGRYFMFYNHERGEIMNEGFAG